MSKFKGRKQKSRTAFGGKSRQAQEYIGRVQKNRRGFAFLIVENAKIPDVYVDQGQSSVLLNGDRVAFTIQKDGRRSAARILKIIERTQKFVLGKIQPGKREYLMTAEGETFDLIGKVKKLLSDQWVVAKIEGEPSLRLPPLVSLSEELGTELKPCHDLRITSARFGLPDEFPKSLDAELKTVRALAESEFTAPGRKDLSALPFVTIDGADAKDFDDAIYVDGSHSESPFVLYVAIADVAFFVKEGGPTDKSALERSTSVYFPGTCIPMLPEMLSNDLCSLRPRENKLAFTAEMHLDRDGRVTHSRFYESTIRTIHRLTYEQVQGFIDSKKYPEDLKLPITNAYHLYTKLKEQRRSRGVLDFDLPESKIDVDKEGNPTRLYCGERFEAHKLIEEFMILANSEVAKALRENHQPALYRVHNTPDVKSLDDLNQLLRALGINHRMTEFTPHTLSKLLEKTKEVKGAKTLHQAILRLQKQARYLPSPDGHFGLALKDYTHFTSPIRRYPDLVVHRALKKLIHQKKGSDKNKGGKSLSEIADETSQKERRAMEAERFIVKRKQCWYLKKHVGDVFSGVISGMTANGLFIELPEFCTDGFLPIEDLLEDYTYDESRMCLRKRPGHSVLHLGDPVKVQIVRVSVEDNQIQFIES